MKEFLRAVIAVAVLAPAVFVASPITPATAAPTWTRSDSSSPLAWTSITSNSDGSRLAAVETNGFVWTSSDFGDTWTKRTTVKRAWASITSSGDGSRLAAVATLGNIFTSSDYGVTWTSQSAAGTRAWTAITSSSDGTKLAACVLGTFLAAGNIWTSTDSGVTWTRQSDAGDRAWTSIASSSDGTHLVAGVSASAGTYGRIWTSTDSGVTWVDRAKAGSRDWIAVASSSDGTRLAAAETPGNIWTSSDSGATWIAQTSAGTRVWRSLASSSDGTRLAAVAGVNGNVWTSSDSGATWVDQAGAGTRTWGSITSSGDGSRLTALGPGVRVWRVVLPTVQFDTNGHGVDPADVFAVSSIAVGDLPVLSAAGYTFLGWSPTISGAVLTSDHAPDADSTLFAQWSANDLNVDFDSRGGSAVVDGATKTGEGLADPGDPTLTGYNFAGWFTAARGGEAVTFPYVHGRTSDFKLFAQWESYPVFVATAQPVPTAGVFTKSKIQMVFVKNTGTGPLVFGLGAVTLSGTNSSDFVIVSDQCSNRTLATNRTCPVYFTFSPQAAGARTANLVFTDNTDQSPNVLELSGVAVTAPISISSISRSISSTLGGGRLEIKGQGFAKGAIVTIGGTQAQVLHRDENSRITVRIPAHVAEVVSVMVTNPDTGVASKDGFTYVLEQPRR